jgi:hypothetical protein
VPGSDREHGASVAPAKVPVQPPVGRVVSRSSVLSLQSRAGNAAVVSLLSTSRGVTPVAQRNGDGVTTVVEKVKESSDLTTLGILVPKWGAEKVKPVADYLGTERCKTMIMVIGSDVVEGMKPEDFLGITKLPSGEPSLQDLAVLVEKAGAGLDNVLTVGKRWSSSLAPTLGALVAFKAKLDVMSPYIQAASASERTEASKDTKLLALAQTNLSRDDYLGLLPALGVFLSPSGGGLTEGGKGHLQAPDVDNKIRTTLALYVADAIKQGRKVEGEVSVVGDADFQLAFDRQWVDTGLLPKGTVAKSTCNAFVDVNLTKRHIWVHRDKGNEGTVVHEGMHKYASPVLRTEQMDVFTKSGGDPGGISQLDEGITEYFTRKVTGPMKITRGNYPNPHDIAQRIATVAGDTVLAAAYFDGAFDALKKKWAPTKWQGLALAIEGKDWAGARKLI